MWRTGNDVLALKWVLINIAISMVILMAINVVEGRQINVRIKGRV